MTMLGYAILAALLICVIALNIWWRRHRSSETRVEKRAEDLETRREAQIW